MNYPIYPNFYSAYPPPGYYQPEGEPQVSSNASPPLHEGFVSLPAPLYGIIGYQPVARQDQQGLMVIDHEPVYGFIYPQFLPCAPAKAVPSAASAAPAPASSSTKKTADAKPPTATGPLVEEKKKEPPAPKDLKLTDDQVGLAIASSDELAKLDTNAIVEEFFATSEPKESFNYPEILKKYLARVETKDRKQYLPLRYQELFDRVNYDKTYLAWGDAILHNPPIEMLRSLHRIQTIYTTFQSSSKKRLVPRFLFPCSISIPNSIKERFNSHFKMLELIGKQDRMVLELTLRKNGKPLHVFLRPLSHEDSFLEKNLGESKEKVCQALKNSAYPALGKGSQKQSRSVTQTQRVVETDTHLEFFFQDGITIKALKTYIIIKN